MPVPARTVVGGFGNVYPVTNSTYDVGTPTSYWDDGYFNHLYVGTLVSGGNVTAHAPSHSSVGADPVNHNTLANLTVGDAHTQYIKVDGTRSFTGPQSMGLNAITNVANPTNGQDAATKDYVDNHKADNATYADNADTVDSFHAINFLFLNGSTAMTGNLSMGNHYIRDVSDPVLNQDAVTLAYYNAHLPATGTGNITGNGTINVLPKFGSATNLIDSLLSSNSTSTYIASNLTFTSGNSIKTSTQDLAIVTGSNKTLVLDTIVYDDLLVPASTAKLGNTHDPGFTVFKTNGAGSQGVYTYWFDASTEEELFFTAQFPHGMKTNSTIHPHIHWTPFTTADGVPADQKVVWGFEYTWADIGQNFTTNTLITTASDKYPNDANVIAGKHYYCDFPDVSATVTAGQSVSSILVCRVFRKAADLADNYEHDAGLLAIDFHYEIDTLGSRYETSK